jgi:hypothetical protein
MGDIRKDLEDMENAAHFGEALEGTAGGFELGTETMHALEKQAPAQIGL